MSTNTWIELPSYGSASWKSPVANPASLPATGNINGDTRVDLSTDTIYVWNGTSWIPVATPGAAIAIDGLIGDVQASGPGVVVATIQPNVVTNAKLAQMPPDTIKGNNTGSTANAMDLTVSQVNTMLGTLINPMTTAGDMIYENSTPATTRLPIGSTGNVLTVSGGLPVWAAPATSGTVTSVSVVSANGLAGTVATATTTPAITLSTTVTGILQGNGTAISAATTGNLTDAGTDGITVTNGTGAVLGTGTSLSQHVADTTHNGYLSSSDWNTFNGKTSGGITALTGDGTAIGPGSAAFTLATVNGNVGSFGSSTAIPNFTVNAKGLVTAAGTDVVIAPAGTLTGTTLASNVISSSLTSVGTISSGTWNGTTIAIANGGTGQTTKTLAFNALSPNSVIGDISYFDGTNNVSLAGNTTSTVKFLQSVGNGTNALAPSYQTIPSAGLSTYFYNNTASDISTYFQMTMTPNTGAGQTFTSGTLGNNTTTTLVSFATPIGFPNLTFIPPGVVTCYITAAQNSAGGETVQLFAEFYTRTSGGVETLISTTALSSILTNVNVAYIFQGSIPTGIVINSTDRFVTKIRAVTGATGGTHTVTLTVADNTAARSEFPAASVDATNFVPYTGATTNLNLGANNFTNSGTISTTNNSVSALTINTSAFVFDSTNFALGINNSTPAVASFIDGINTSGATKRLLLTGYGTASLVGFRTRLARGTVGTPAAVQNGDILLFLNAEGYGTSQFPATATGAISMYAGETFTNTSNATYIGFNTTPTGAVTSAEAMRINTTGNILIGQTTDNATDRLQVTGSETITGNVNLATAAASKATIGNSSSTAIHQINGGLIETTRTVTSGFTVDTTTTDYLVYLNNTAAMNVTLPVATNGRILIFKDIKGTAQTNPITFIRNGGTGSIDGVSASYVFQTNFGSVTFAADGTNWWSI